MPKKPKTISDAASEFGRIGGKANYKKNKATWSEKSRKAVKSRWAKSKKNLTK